MTPPATAAPAMSPNAMPQDSQANVDIMSVITRGTSWQWMLLLGLALLGVAQAAATLAYQTYVGLGIAGYQAPVFWAVYIVTFVFWIGIGHAGTLISAILFLFRAKWRNAINRSAEAMTVFAVLTAALFPLIHIGRLWKFYFLIPYPNQRGLWVNFKSPLLWDVFAVNTYMTISIVFFFVGLIPDFAIARDRTTGDSQVHLHHLGTRMAGQVGPVEGAQPHRASSIRTRDSARPVCALGCFLGLCNVHRAGLARDDLCALLRGRRRVWRLRDGDGGDDPSTPNLRP